MTESLSATLSKKAVFNEFTVWLVGDTPLITHSWSHKARLEMLQKQAKAPKAGKEARDPEQDFISSLYELEKDVYGFPAMGIKNAILSAAHKDKGLPRSTLKSGLWLNADMYRVRPAMAGAVCDMPLQRIYGSAPEMREDMVKIGAGLNKIANLAYRAQFTVWATKLTGRYNSSIINSAQLAFIIQDAGLSCGIGEWRNEKSGMFGAFHLATVEEEEKWNKFAAGKGKMPIPSSYKQAAE